MKKRLVILGVRVCLLTGLVPRSQAWHGGSTSGNAV